MMPKLIADLGLGPLAEKVLLGKLNFIHTEAIKLAEEEIQRSAKNGNR